MIGEMVAVQEVLTTWMPANPNGMHVRIWRTNGEVAGVSFGAPLDKQGAVEIHIAISPEDARSLARFLHNECAVRKPPSRPRTGGAK